LDAPGQQNQVEGAIGAVEQYRPEEIENRAEQREEQVTQRSCERLGTPVQSHERHRGESQQLEGDIKVEEVSADEHGVECPPDRQQQCPEHQRHARFRNARGGELRSREYPNPTDQQRGGHDHHRGEPIRTQCHAERRIPAADRILQYIAGAPDGDGDRDCDGEPGRHHDDDDALGVPPTQRQQEKHPGDRQDDRQNEEKAPRRCRIHHKGRLFIRWPGRLPGLLEKSQQQRHRQRRCRESDDKAGNDQRLRYRIATKPGRCTPVGDDPK
jgi:hypothetical protein